MVVTILYKAFLSLTLSLSFLLSLSLPLSFNSLCSFPLLPRHPSSLHRSARFVPPGSVAVHADVTCGARHSEYCQFVAFRTPAGHVVVVLTNDEITVGPIAGTGVGMLVTPWLAKGQGSLTLGSKTLSWAVACNGKTAKGTLPWKAIQTVVMPC